MIYTYTFFNILFCISSCHIQCKFFEYEKLKIDTSFYSTNHLFHSSSGETISMQCIEKIEYNKDFSNPKIADADECNNGVIFKYQCKKLNIDYLCSFIVRNNRDYEYSFNSHFIGVDVIIYKNVNEISFERSINQILDHDFKSIKIKHGKLVRFIDCKGVEWSLDTTCLPPRPPMNKSSY